MANPKLNDGFTRIPHELIEAYAKSIPGEVPKILLAIIRKTLGWNKQEDWISYSQFVEMTGMKKQNVNRALKKLHALGMIIMKGNGVYALNQDYDLWNPDVMGRKESSQGITGVISTDDRESSQGIPTKDNRNHTKDNQKAGPSASSNEDMEWIVKALKKLAEKSFRFRSILDDKYGKNYYKLAGQLSKQAVPSCVVFGCGRLYKQIENGSTEIKNPIAYLSTLISNPNYNLGDGNGWNEYATPEEYYRSLFES